MARPSPPSCLRSWIAQLDLQLRGIAVLTFLSNRKRVEISRLRGQLNSITNTVERFYEVLGPRNWIFHDRLSTDDVRRILDRNDRPEDVEEDFIAYLLEPETQKHWVAWLRHRPGLRERSHLLERAKDHLDRAEYDSCALHLVAIMDGFVNDFEPALRKNLGARAVEDMTAWDSVVGHHLGLTHTLRTYGKEVKKRIDEEVTDVLRNGIVHGTVVNYNNPIVALKAWNMLFAVVDWATATERARRPQEPEPSLGESLRRYRRIQEEKKQLEAWQSTRLTPSDDDFQEHQIARLTGAFMKAWQTRNYGAMARLRSHRWSGEQTSGSIAGLLRKRFTPFDLQSWNIAELVNQAPAIWLARGEARVNDQQGSIECRWMIEDEKGDLAFGKEEGIWRLVNCEPYVWRAV